MEFGVDIEVDIITQFACCKLCLITAENRHLMLLLLLWMFWLICFWRREALPSGLSFPQAKVGEVGEGSKFKSMPGLK